MNSPDNKLISLDQFIEQEYGKRGTSKRKKFENGYENFKIGFLLQQARIEIIQSGFGGHLEFAIYI